MTIISEHQTGLKRIAQTLSIKSENISMIQRQNRNKWNERITKSKEISLSKFY